MLRCMDYKKIIKSELHRHLELSIRHSTLKELAPHFQIEVPDDETFAQRFLITEPMRDLGSVLNKFLDTQKLLASEEILERITYEACEDAFNEGIRILELRYAPTFVQQGHDFSFEQIHMAIVKGMQRAERDFAMAVGLLCIIQRILPVKEAEAVTQFAIENRDTFIGLDLADNEEGFDSKPFSPFFQRARDAGLGITVHAGEANLPKAPRYVRDAIDYLGATRIGHGLQIYRDQEMIDYVKGNNVVLELCPTSNWLTSAVEGVEQHPFKKLMDAGVRVTINSDDPGIFNIDLTHEYCLLAKHFGLSEIDLKQCSDEGARASFIAADKKQKVWPRPL